MKPNVKQLGKGRDQYTGLKYSKTPRHTLKQRTLELTKEELRWKEIDDKE